MTEKKPFWKDRILWTYSEYYKAYIATYAVNHYLSLAMIPKTMEVIKDD
jgi:hypothetical protein